MIARRQVFLSLISLMATLAAPVVRAAGRLSTIGGEPGTGAASVRAMALDLIKRRGPNDLDAAELAGAERAIAALQSSVEVQITQVHPYNIPAFLRDATDGAQDAEWPFTLEDILELQSRAASYKSVCGVCWGEFPHQGPVFRLRFDDAQLDFDVRCCYKDEPFATLY